MPVQKTISEVTREALLLHPQGLTVRELAKMTGYAQDLLISCLRRTYGCYIADFKPVVNGSRNFNALWCCVAVPANATKPAFSKHPVKVVDDEMARAQKRRNIQRAASKRYREKQKMINNLTKELIKEKPTLFSEYKPQKTTWVNVPSWSQAA